MSEWRRFRAAQCLLAEIHPVAVLSVINPRVDYAPLRSDAAAACLTPLFPCRIGQPPMAEFFERDLKYPAAGGKVHDENRSHSTRSALA